MQPPHTAGLGYTEEGPDIHTVSHFNIEELQWIMRQGWSYSSSTIIMRITIQPPHTAGLGYPEGDPDILTVSHFNIEELQWIMTQKWSYSSSTIIMRVKKQRPHTAGLGFLYVLSYMVQQWLRRSALPAHISKIADQSQ